MKRILNEFFQAWIDWVDRGAKDDEFNRGVGLCSSYKFWFLNTKTKEERVGIIGDEVKRLFRRYRED